MVKSEKGIVSIEGDIFEILADTTVLLKGITETIAKTIGDEEAKEIILGVVADSFKTEEELMQEISMKEGN